MKKSKPGEKLYTEQHRYSKIDPKIQQLIDTAKESKHTDAILLLIEKKPELAERIQKIVKESIPEDEGFKKAIAIVCEYVFNSCVGFLSDDKKEK